jgi:hypothetical protein
MVYIMIGTWRMITIAVHKYLELYHVHCFFLFFFVFFCGGGWRGVKFCDVAMTVIDDTKV